ncbi:MAG: THUMP domain-containing class I SAM-dependent RNA methyltransferase [Gammaproteobacteria bacterium]
MSTQTETFFAPCPRGLEAVLRAELEQLGAQAVIVLPGGVSFTGPFALCYAVNLHSRIASRVLWRVFHGNYRNEHDIFQAAQALPWQEWFPVSRTIKVKVSAQQCPLPSLDFVTLRIKDAVCDRFRMATGARPTVATRRPDIRIDAFLDRQNVTLYLDTSGEALFKRGLRTAGTEAPVRENLAAGILRLVGWTTQQPLLDPMCGSGTFLLEAALIARNIPPGLRRRFAFEKLSPFDARAWRAQCEAGRTRQMPQAPCALYGSDIHGTAIQAARANLKAAGLLDAVTLKQADVLDVTPPAGEGLLVTNPPYGVRLGDKEQLAAFYPRLGDSLKRNFAGWRAYLFTADLRLPKLIGLAASRRTPLFNGPLECRLYEFTIVSGTLRKQKVAADEAEKK